MAFERDEALASALNPDFSPKGSTFAVFSFSPPIHSSARYNLASTPTTPLKFPLPWLPVTP